MLDLSNLPTVVWVAIIVFAVVAVLALAVVWLRGRLRAAGVYVIPRTKFGPALVFSVEGDDGEPIRVLNIKGMYQSATYLDERYTEPVFTYYRAFDCMFEAGIPLDRVLMIGGGGYAYPKHFIATTPHAGIDVVEIDPVVTNIARRYFFLDRLIEEYDTETNGRLGLITGDGRVYLDECAAGQKRYDVVVNDSFCGGDPAPSLVTVEAARSVQGSLNEGGLYVANVVSALQGEKARFMRALVRTLGQVFSHVYVIPCGMDDLADRDNNIVIATNGTYEFAGAVTVATSEDDPVLTDACNPVGELVK